MDFYLDKELIFNRMIPNEMILSYISIRGLLSHDPSNEYVSLNRMAFSLLGDTGCEYKETLLTALNTGLEQLVSVGLLKVKNKLSNYEYILDISPTQLDTQNCFFHKGFSGGYPKNIPEQYEDQLSVKATEILSMYHRIPEP